MTSKKCIFKPQEPDDDQQSDSLLSPCFQVGSDVKISSVPLNGEEYLLTVMKERQECAVVTKCNKDYSKFAKNQSCFVKEMPLAQVPENLKPTIEWQNIQVADFSDVRMYVSRVRAKKSLWPDTLKTIQLDQYNLPGWKNFFEKYEPTLSCVLGLPHTKLDQGLESLTVVLKDVKHGDTIDHKTGQWIYAFLACTRQPLLSETTSILRDLARKCAEIRSHINPEDDAAVISMAPLNIFICLVARYFRQYDLAD